MDIELIVLTCDSNLHTRAKGIESSFGKHFDLKFLTDSSIYNCDRIIGYDTPQNYDGIQEKYYQFFTNFIFEKDYYFFIDDDTFVIKNNLELLQLPPKEHKFCVYRRGFLDSDGTDQLDRQTFYPLQKIKGDRTYLPLNFPSGGSGFILSKSSCISIQNYLRKISITDVPSSGHGDVTIGFWLRNCDVELIETDKFWWNRIGKIDCPFIWNGKLRSFKNSDIDLAITFHYIEGYDLDLYYKNFY